MIYRDFQGRLHVFSVFVFMVFCFTDKKLAFSKMPLPIISKLYKFLKIDWILTWNETRKDLDQYQNERQKFQKKLEKQNQITTLSMTIESSFEASFQTYFQTVYLIPSIVLNIASASGITDLVNFETLSILFSFFTFSWASFTIRYIFQQMQT